MRWKDFFVPLTIQNSYMAPTRKMEGSCVIKKYIKQIIDYDDAFLGGT